MAEPVSNRHHWTTLVFTLLLGLPAAALLFSGIHINPVAAACVYGVGILAGAFLLSWADEVAELDISASLAIADSRLAHHSPGICHRVGARLGRRLVVRYRDSRNHGRNATSGGQRNRGQPAAYRSGLVRRYPDLLAQTPGRFGYAWKDGSGSDLSDGSHAPDLRHLRHAW